MLDLTSTGAGHPGEYYYACEPTCHPCGQDRPSDIAVIVTAYNSAAHLRECVESILAQSLKPEKIVIVDDHSKDDNTLAIAHAFEQHGVLVLRTPENLGMCGARIHGLAETESPVIMFFDGDDVMPPDYLKTMRRELNGNGFVYPGRQMFGNLSHYVPAPKADRSALWRSNYCPSPSLMWRHVYEAAGGWQKPNNEGTLPDWDLFLRMSGIMPFAPSSQDVFVRKHERNFSSGRWSRPISEIFADTRVHAATMTVGSVYSGRLGQKFLHRWLAHVCSSLDLAGKTAELLILDDSPDGFCLLPQSFPGHSLRSIRVERIHRDRSCAMTPFQVSRMLATAYNRLKSEASGDLLWMIEDDILVPHNAAKDLMRTILCSPVAPVPAACGCYRSRHAPDRYILSSCDGKTVTHARRLPDGPSPVQLTGTGCLMVLRDLVSDIAFEPMWTLGSIKSNAHDWTLSSRLFSMGSPVIALPNVCCPHFQTETAFV